VIAPMAKLQVLAPRSSLPEVLAFLQAEGVLELRSPPSALPLETTTLSSAEGDLARLLETAAARIDAVLPALGDEKMSSGNGRAPALDPASPALLARIDALDAELAQLAARRRALEEEAAVSERYARLLAALTPIRPTLPAGATPHLVGLVMRKDARALALLGDELGRLTDGEFDLQWRDAEPGTVAALVAVPRARAAAVGRLLFEQGVEELKLPAPLASRAIADALLDLLKRAKAIPDERRAVDEEAQALARTWGTPLRRARDEALDRLARLRAIAQCGCTGHAFLLYGWTPREQVTSLVAMAAARFGGRLDVAELPIAREERGEVPVLLRKRPLLAPFELLLGLVSPPRYGSIDPTPYLALFFPLFFGLIVGDVGFGALLLVLGIVAQRKGWGGSDGRRAAHVAIACALSAIVFGVAFGEVFGEFGEPLGLHPLLLDRRRAFLPFLGATLALGGVHVVLGMVLGIVDAAREGHAREAAARALRLAMLAIAIVGIAALAGKLPPWAGRAAAIALGALTLGAIVVAGPLAPLELVLALGNILSYSRLMALGMAGVMLAEVANRVATMLHPTALGVALAIVLHAANFALALLSPTVCALRLNYVEFFEKFYEEGGRPFRPFQHRTR